MLHVLRFTQENNNIFKSNKTDYLYNILNKKLNFQ